VKKTKIVLLTVLVFTFLLSVLTGCETTHISHDGDISVWNKYFIYPFSILILYTANTWLHQSIGFSIMLVTVGVRMILAPLNIMQQKNQLKKHELQPKMKELEEQYAKKSGKDKQQQLAIAKMHLMKENGANPLLDFLPLLIQFPVLSIMYYGIRHLNTIYHATFLWADLAHADPYFILPIIAAVATYIQSRVAQQQPNEVNNPLGNVGLFIAPIMVFVFGTFSPSGLVLYWATGSLFMIVQTLLLNYFFKKPTKAVVG